VVALLGFLPLLAFVFAQLRSVVLVGLLLAFPAPVFAPGAGDGFVGAVLGAAAGAVGVFFPMVALRAPVRVWNANQT
jgi:Na+/H+-translocating membrane pyrophosphatase